MCFHLTLKFFYNHVIRLVFHVCSLQGLRSNLPIVVGVSIFLGFIHRRLK